MKPNSFFKALVDGIKEDAEIFANDRVLIAPVAELLPDYVLPSTAPIPENPAAVVEGQIIQCPNCKFVWDVR